MGFVYNYFIVRPMLLYGDIIETSYSEVQQAGPTRVRNKVGVGVTVRVRIRVRVRVRVRVRQ